MADLTYLALTSLDGYVEDDHGGFDWCRPDAEVHAAVNDLERPIGTYLYGRRLYDVMAGWETMHTLPDQTAETLDFAALWQGAEKVVFSRTLTGVRTARTRIERELAPDAIRSLKAASTSGLSIGGAELAGQAMQAGLVDELHLFASPVLVGGGRPALPDGVRLDLELLDLRRFGNGVVHTHYRIRN